MGASLLAKLLLFYSESFLIRDDNRIISANWETSSFLDSIRFSSLLAAAAALLVARYTALSAFISISCLFRLS